jgi:hypothetical protein
VCRRAIHVLCLWSWISNVSPVLLRPNINRLTLNPTPSTVNMPRVCGSSRAVAAAARYNRCSLVEFYVASLAVYGSVAAAKASTSLEPAASGSFPPRPSTIPTTTVPSASPIHSVRNEPLPPSPSSSAESEPESLSPSNVWNGAVSRGGEQSINNFNTGGENGGESDDGGTDEEADSSDGMEEASSVWMLLTNSPTINDDETETATQTLSITAERPRETRVSSSPQQQSGSPPQKAVGARMEADGMAMPKSTIVKSPASRTIDSKETTERVSARNQSLPSRYRKRPMVSSQPLQTLEKLQQMLDETDYMTSTSRSNRPASLPLPAANGPDVPERLWTSKDRYKYKRQQQRLLNAPRSNSAHLSMRNSGTATSSPPKFALPHKDVEVDSDDSTDDGLGYVLPDLPVYHSDAEGEDETLVGEDEHQSLSATNQQHLDTRQGSLVPPQQQQLSQRYQNSRYLPLTPEQHHSVGNGPPKMSTATGSVNGAQPVPPVQPEFSTLPPLVYPNYYNTALHPLSPEQQRYLLEQQRLSQVYSHYIPQQQQPYHPQQRRQPQNPPQQAFYDPLHMTYPMLPIPANTQKNGYSMPLYGPPPHYLGTPPSQQQQQQQVYNPHAAWVAPSASVEGTVSPLPNQQQQPTRGHWSSSSPPRMNQPNTMLDKYSSATMPLPLHFRTRHVSEVPAHHVLSAEALTKSQQQQQPTTGVDEQAGATRPTAPTVTSDSGSNLFGYASGWPTPILQDAHIHQQNGLVPVRS